GKPLDLERRGSGVRRGERSMRGGMPILSHDSIVEAAHQRVDERYDTVALSDRKRPARHEIELQVDRQKNVFPASRNHRRHGAVSFKADEGASRMAFERKHDPSAKTSGAIGSLDTFGQ